MRTGFYMNCQAVCPCSAKIGQIPLWLLDHEVDVQRERRYPTHRPYDERAQRDVRHKMAIHYIYMDVITPSRLHLGDLLAKSREIGRKDGWCDLDTSTHAAHRQYHTCFCTKTQVLI